MKISKLFHWLYAVIMLLPIFAIGVKCAYAIFNKNAYKSFTGNQKYQTTLSLLTYKDNNNLPYNSFTNNNVTNYYVDLSILSNLITSNSTSIYGDNVAGSYGFNVQEITITKNNVETTYINSFITFSTDRNSPYNGRIRIYEDLYFNTSNSYIQKTYDYYCQYYINGQLQTPSYDITNYNTISNIEFIGYDSKFILTSTNYNLIDNSLNRYETNLMLATSTIDKVFYFAIDEVQQSPLFNWAENSFLVAPFAYIVSLFSMPTNSPIVMLLSYWLAISIIWLVFDLIMYIPLLVHRWLDKGVLE